MKTSSSVACSRSPGHARFASIVTVLLWLTLSACSHEASPSDDGGVPSNATGGQPNTGGRATGGDGRATGGVAAAGRGGNATGGGTTAGRGGNVTGGDGNHPTGGLATGGQGGNATGGRAATGGSGGNPGTGTSCATGTPTAAANGAAFPFPQHRAKSSCVYPTSCMDSTAAAAWTAYSKKFIVDGGSNTLRVQRTENGNDTVSEGMGYGMLFAAVMADKPTFDKLWQYVQAHNDSHGLMNWHLGSGGDTVGANSATDGDEDIGFALVLADKQWGGYTSTTKEYLTKMAAADFATDGTVRGGDEFANVNPSYLAPAFYRTFAAYTGDKRWTTILDKSYQILKSTADGTTGLVPDWQGGDSYGYDAARTPFRVALDACWNGEARAIEFSTKIAAFFAKLGAAAIKDGFKLNGSVTGQVNNATFVGPAGASGMAGHQSTLVNDVYAAVSATATSGGDSYYNTSWAFFTTLMMTGNFIDFTNP